MKHMFVVGGLLLTALTLVSCVQVQRTSYEAIYVMKGDVTQAVSKDSLAFVKDTIFFVNQGKRQMVDGNVMEVITEVTGAEKKIENRSLYYRISSNRNKVLAECRMLDIDGNGVFDSFSITGDITLISGKLGENIRAFYGIVNEDISSLKINGKKKVVDAATGKVIE